jgi:hypothetical protein
MPRHGESKARVIEILDANPRATNADIAETLSLSRARVSQIRIAINRPQGRRKKVLVDQKGCSWFGNLRVKLGHLVGR